MRELRAEWTKLRTLPSTFWLLLATVALTVAVSAAAAATVSCPAAGCRYDAPKIGLSGVQAGQAIVVILAVLSAGGEYGTGMIRTTLTAMPRRTAVLAAKATLLTALTSAAGTVAVLGSVLAARLILPGNGFVPAHGYPLLSLADGPTLRAAAGSVLYLALIALLGLGVATAVRDSATGIGLVFGLLYVLSVLPYLVTDPYWGRFLWRISPMNAGLAVQSTTHLSSLPIGPWAGLCVLAAWAGAGLLTGGLLFRLRDA
ncbi:ABC transporter permease [Actinoallomurus rhizosphaericola]|uniref:ABC transporter permease n=1 Tax=Actinoallomurus rhizosphaericola TaxID=2952536 RepID=UPI0020927B71|nr:ABC transporter permease [Actinoallomurus rhizosphaericola]MCO5995965.1 ABC transporter permease [Actinoallomurus rhizosphaericola]